LRKPDLKGELKGTRHSDELIGCIRFRHQRQYRQIGERGRSSEELDKCDDRSSGDMDDTDDNESKIARRRSFPAAVLELGIRGAEASNRGAGGKNRGAGGRIWKFSAPRLDGLPPVFEKRPIST
jgi:hypothetical protein